MRHDSNNELLSKDLPESRSLAVGFEATGFQENDFTWEQLLRVLRKNRQFALLIAGGITASVFVWVLLQKDFYRPTARLELAPPSSGINTLHEIETSSEAENQDYLETQVQILSSNALAISVIRALHLDSDPEFVNTREAAASSASKLKPAASVETSAEPAILQEQLDLATLTFAETGALERFRRNLSVNSVRNTRLVEISFASRDPRKAQLITNTLVTNFIDQNYKHRYTTTMQASAWLSSQLLDLRKKVDQSAQALADYQKKSGLVEVDDRDVPISQLMSEINRQASDAQANRIEDEAFVRMIDEGHADAAPALRDDKLYQDLMARYAELRTQLAQAKTVYGDDNVNVKKLQDQLVELSIQIDAERKRAIARARSSYAAAKHRERLMMAEREKLRAKMGHMSSQLTSYHMLKAEANANAELYNTLQGRLREAGIYAGLRSSNIRVVDLATNLLKPTGPHRLLLVALGAVSSCVFAIVLSFCREGFRNTVRTPDDVKSWVGLPSLALLPDINAGPAPWGLPSRTFGDSLRMAVDHRRPRVTIGIMKAPTLQSEAMRDLRTVLIHARAAQAPSVILISSSLEGEGKTTVAVNFAAALAQLGQTCLVEADLRRPGFARVFRSAPKIGLTEVLKNVAPLDRALIQVPGVDNLAVLPGGTIPTSPADLLSSPQLAQAMQALKNQFNYVVIDSPPVLRFSDARLLSSCADHVVLVARYGVTTRRAMQRTAELLNDMRASVAGVVLNGIDLSSPDYHYYTYGYSTTYSKRVDGPSANPIDKTGTGGDSKQSAKSAHA